MRKFLLSLGAAATLAAGMIASTATTASADSWGRGGGGYHRGGDFGGDRWRARRGWRNHGGDALAAGAIGLGVGAILGSALTDRPYEGGRFYGQGYYGNGYYGGGYYGRPAVVLEGPVYRERQVYYRPVPVYRDYRPARAYRSFDRPDACAARYRTYDYRTNTFVGYDGYRHLCRL